MAMAMYSLRDNGYDAYDPETDTWTRFRSPEEAAYVMRSKWSQSTVSTMSCSSSMITSRADDLRRDMREWEEQRIRAIQEMTCQMQAPCDKNTSVKAKEKEDKQTRVKNLIAYYYRR